MLRKIHHVGVVVADHLGRLADRLAAGRTGRQAAVVGPLDLEMSGQVGGCRLQLLLRLADLFVGTSVRHARRINERPRHHGERLYELQACPH